MNRAAKRQKTEELKRWNNHVVPELAAIEEAFHNELFEDNGISYQFSYLKFSEQYMRVIRRVRHYYKFITGDPLAFAAKYSPLEKAAA